VECSKAKFNSGLWKSRAEENVMKNKSAILKGVSTLALATTFFAQGAYAEGQVPVIVSSATATSLSPAAVQAGTAAPQEKTDAIVTSAASANSIADPQNSSSMSIPGNGNNGILSKFTARVDEVYYGASLSGLGDPNQPNDIQKDAAGDPVFIRSNVGLGYKINPDLVVGMVNRIDYLPKSNIGTLWEDSYVRLMAPKLIDKGEFTAVGDLRFYLPTSHLSRMNGEETAIMTRFVPSYTPTGSRFTYGTIFYHTWYVRDGRVDSVDAFATNAWSSEFYAGPNVSYQLTPTVSLSALYEFDAVRLSNANGLLNYTSDTHSSNGYTDFEPGVNWDITPNVSLNPFLNMYPGSNFSLDTTNINVVLGIKLL
jgi:hypothetical protein